MIRYWKAEEKGGAWRQVDDDPKSITELLTNNVVRHMTCLSLDIPFEKETPQKAVKYFGDMYFDIDVKPDEINGTHEDAIKVSINSCRELVSKLLNQQATGLKIYATGSKGFHVIVPWKNFGNLRAQPYLFDTYRQIAVHFKVDWLDMSMYSGKKGKMMRMPNVRRDKGTYKVPLTVEELNELTYEDYLDLVSKPRTNFVFDEPKKSASLSAILSMAKDEATKLRKEREKLSTAMPKDNLAEDYKDNGLPGCIERLVTYGDERDGSNFNQAALQLATYCKDAGLPQQEVKSLADRMGQSVKSSSYSSTGERADAVFNLYQSVLGTDYHFSKGGLFSVVNRCNKCSICQTKHELQGDTAIEIDERLQIAIGTKGYEVGFGKMLQPATNFHLLTKAVKVGYPVSWHATPTLRRADRRPAGLLLEMTTFDSLGASEPIEVNMSEDAVNNPMLARDSLTAAGGSWLTGPDFWNKIKMVLTDRGNLKAMNAEEITTVPHFGTSVFLRDGEYVTVYCDPDSHLLSDPEMDEVFRTEFPGDPKRDKIRNSRSRMPNLAHVPPFSRKMERGSRGFDVENLQKLINSLTCVLPDAESAIVLGWFCAAHIKPHLRATGINFPLLNMYGQPESGKTATASLMLSLHGVLTNSDAPVVDASQSTLPTIREKLSQSNSVPTILDEMNQSMDYRKYQELVSLMKSSWDHSVTSKMDGAHSMRDMIPTSPLVTCGEQTISTEHRSLRTRTLEVAFNLAWKADDRRRRYFMYVASRKTELASFGLDMLVEAVQGVDFYWVRDRFEQRLEDVPKAYGSDRKREGYAACLMGLDFLGKTLERLGANCSKRLGQLEAALIKNVGALDDGVIDSDIDRIIRRIVGAVNNYLMDFDPEAPKLVSSVARYSPTTDELWFLPGPTYDSLKRSSRDESRRVYLMASEDFEKTMKEAAPDYITRRGNGWYSMPIEVAKARGWWRESEEKGIEEVADI